MGKSLQEFFEPVIKKDKSTFKAPEDKITTLLLNLIHSPVLNLQMGAYILLSDIANIFVDRDKAIVDDLENQLLNICTFEDILKTSQNIVNALLMDFK